MSQTYIKRPQQIQHFLPFLIFENQDTWNTLSAHSCMHVVKYNCALLQKYSDICIYIDSNYKKHARPGRWACVKDKYMLAWTFINVYICWQQKNKNTRHLVAVEHFVAVGIAREDIFPIILVEEWHQCHCQQLVLVCMCVTWLVHEDAQRLSGHSLACVCVCVCVCSCVCVSLKRVLHVEWHINVPAPGTGWQRPIGCLFFDDKAQSPKKRLWLASLWRKEHSKYHVHLQNLYISHADRKINKYAQFMQTTCQIHTIHASTKKIYNSCRQYIWRTHTHVYYCSRSSSSARAYTCRHYCAWQSTQNMGNTQFIHTTCMHRIYKYITVHEVALLLELVDVERKRLSCLKTCESKHGK